MSALLAATGTECEAGGTRQSNGHLRAGVQVCTNQPRRNRVDGDGRGQLRVPDHWLVRPNRGHVGSGAHQRTQNHLGLAVPRARLFQAGSSDRMGRERGTVSDQRHQGTLLLSSPELDLKPRLYFPREGRQNPKATCILKADTLVCSYLKMGTKKTS